MQRHGARLGAEGHNELKAIETGDRLRLGRDLAGTAP